MNTGILDKNRIIPYILIAVLFAFMLCSCGSEEVLTEPTEEELFEPSLSEAAKKIYQFSDNTEETPIYRISIKDYGNIYVRLFPQDAPRACERFEELVEKGYYEDMNLGRVILNYLIQTSVTADSEYTAFEDEYSQKLFPFRGALLFANEGTPSTNRSEFMIVTTGSDFLSSLTELVDYKDISLSEYLNKSYGTNLDESSLIPYMVYGGAPWLYGRHTVFGQVYSGFDVLDKISEAEVNNDFVPYDNIVIEDIKKIGGK